MRGHGCFTMDQYKELVDILLKMLEEHFQRAEERQQKRNDEDYDEQVCFFVTSLDLIFHDFLAITNPVKLKWV